MPLIFLRASAWVKEMDKIFAHMRKRYGDKGSPYLRPWEGLKDLVILPFINKVYSTDVTHSMIHLTHLGSNLITVRTAFKKFQLTLS